MLTIKELLQNNRLLPLNLPLQKLLPQPLRQTVQQIELPLQLPRQIVQQIELPLQLFLQVLVLKKLLRMLQEQQKAHNLQHLMLL